MGFLFKILPQKTIPLLAISGLVITLALFRTPSKVENKITEVSSSPTVKIGQDEINKETNENLNNATQESTTNKVNISVDTNTTDGKTSGSANVEITKDNETQTFSKSVNSVSDGNNFSVNVNQGTVKFDVDVHKRTVNKSNFDQEIKVTSK